MLSLAQAAKATGKAKATIARAIKAGRLSATRNEAGGYTIDPAELDRVFPFITGDRAGAMKQVAPGSNGTGSVVGEDEGLRLLLAEREETIRDLRARLDDMCTRLDASETERRQLSDRLAGLLKPPAPEYRPPWWRRWFR